MSDRLTPRSSDSQHSQHSQHPQHPQPTAPHSFARLLGRRLWVGGLAFLVAAAALATLALSGVSAGGPAEATVTSATTTRHHAALSDADRAAAKRGRAELRADLHKARALEGTARTDAVKAIRAKVRDGGYGAVVKKSLARRAHRRAAVLALLPDQMQADLKALRTAAPGQSKEQRKAARQAIAKKAADGGYGAKVEAASKKLRGFYRR